MKYPIIIPSRGRAEEVITIDRMPQELYAWVCLYVPKEEYDDYCSAYGDKVRFSPPQTTVIVSARSAD